MVRSLDKVIAIVGPTASGKSGLALALAKKINGVILNCDSVQVYKNFNVGSAKPTREELDEVPHRLLDLVSWDQNFDAAQYRTLALQCIEEELSKGRTPILVGGTGLYFRALCGDKFHDLPSDAALRKQLEELTNEELYQKLVERDPIRAKQIHLNDRFRLRRACEVAILTGRSLSSISSSDKEEENKDRPFTVLCKPSSEELLKRIELRSKLMLEQGLIEEVRHLLASGCPESAKPMQSIGYLQVCEFLKNNTTEKDLLEKIIIATRQYARKQLKWFRHVPIDLELSNPYDVPESIDILTPLKLSK